MKLWLDREIYRAAGNNGSTLSTKIVWLKEINNGVHDNGLYRCKTILNTALRFGDAVMVRGAIHLIQRKG